MSERRSRPASTDGFLPNEVPWPPRHDLMQDIEDRMAIMRRALQQLEGENRALRLQIDDLSRTNRLLQAVLYSRLP